MSFRPGFDERWTSEEDFILGITKDIWEDRRVHGLLDYYAPDLVVRSPAGIVKGNSGIIAATMATLAEFPDRELLGEDVIWTDAGADAFLSSHRLVCSATHSGAGIYGAPTGRKLTYRIIADCFCRDGAVADEWLVRDQGAIVRQMGHDPKNWARDLIHREGGPENAVQPFTPDRNVSGPYLGTGNDHPAGDMLADILGGAMSRDFSVIGCRYDRAAELFYWGHRHGHGPEYACTTWMSLRAAIPDGDFSIEHRMGSGSSGFSPRAAVRWSLTGKHEGHGTFGEPTGVPVHVMGMTHAEFGPGGLRREWTLIDETAIWKQILLGTG